MPSIEPTRPASLLDFLWRRSLRVAFLLARIWWRVRRPHHEGALVAIYVGDALLMLKSSYRSGWNFPGGSVHRGETPETAALREMDEEIGLRSYPLRAAGSVSGVWDGRKDCVHFFELHLDRLPDLRLDNREIIAARLASPDELRGMALTGAVLAYLGKDRRA
jgi:8-oxo-dGTP diphosphatase